MTLSPWLLFIANLPGRHQTLRMRIWRSLKAAGAGALRDGVYLLPGSGAARELFERHRAEIQQEGGTAYILPIAPDALTEEALRELFDRRAQYQAIASKLRALELEFKEREELDARRRLGALGREAAALAAIDFLPGESRRQLDQALADANAAFMAQFSPEEPSAAKRAIARLDPRDYHDRIWATRERLWIDRVCSAWLIRRFIDPQATFLWLKRPQDCPADAVGFDFDGAAFTHVDSKVTFEVLLASFGLEADGALARLGALVHYLDVGGIAVPEAAGLAAIVGGARSLRRGDDALLSHVGPLLDALYQAYCIPEG